MKKTSTTIARLLGALLVLSASHVSASYSNKTFLMPRPTGINLPLQRVSFEEMHEYNREQGGSGNLEITGFYRESSSNRALGKYFGVNNKNTFTFGYQNSGANVFAQWFILDSGMAASAQKATIRLDPSHKAYGLSFSYLHALCKIVPGLYLRASLPLERVENDLGFYVNGFGADTIKSYFAGTLSAGPVGAGGAANGFFSGAAGYSSQQALQNAKIAGKRSVTGFSDLDLELGYVFMRREKYDVAVNLGLTIPTGNAPTGRYLFEPVHGNGKHFAFGGGADFTARLWEHDNQNIKFSVAADYRYLFESSERRTFGIPGGGTMPSDPTTSWDQWGWYDLIGTANTPLRDQQFIPAANLFTQNAAVTPGNLVDAMAGFTYNYGGLTVDLGYNLYYRGAESVRRKDAWDPTKYGWVVGNEDPSAAGAFDINPATNPDAGPVDNTQLVPESAATPAQLSNKVYAQVGYVFTQWAYPMFMSVGGHYEFRTNNAAIENWGLNGKVGISF